MAWTELYVDPSIAADSGTGTIGDPYGDLEYCIKQSTFDTTNGTRVNIKAGTAEILAAAIEVAVADTSVSAAWAPTHSARMTLQGYTATAGDGGIGAIDGNGAGIFITPSLDFLNLIDLDFSNSGTAELCDIDNDCFAFNCKFTGGTYGLRMDDVSTCMNCWFVGQTLGCLELISGYIGYNYFDPATNGNGCLLNTRDGTIERNIVNVAGSGIGILMADECHASHNSVYSDGGTGTGIIISGVSRQIYNLSNNLVEGFSGVGGIGIDTGAATGNIQLYAGNAVRNCTTPYGGTAVVNMALDNETLTLASPFTSASTGDFSPVDTGNVKEGALPSEFYSG